MRLRSRRPMKRAPRGYILAFVLVMLLVLTALGASVLKSSVSEAASLDASRFQTQAIINANAGIQDGLARVRSGAVAWQQLPICSSAEACPPTPPPWVLGSPIVPPETQSRYTYTIFRRGRLGLDGMGGGVSTGSQLTLVVISSQGTSQDNPQYSAVIEVEVQMPSGTTRSNEIAGGG